MATTTTTTTSSSKKQAFHVIDPRTSGQLIFDEREVLTQEIMNAIVLNGTFSDVYLSIKKSYEGTYDIASWMHMFISATTYVNEVERYIFLANDLFCVMPMWVQHANNITMDRFDAMTKDLANVFEERVKEHVESLYARLLALPNIVNLKWITLVKNICRCVQPYYQLNKATPWLRNQEWVLRMTSTVNVYKMILLACMGFDQEKHVYYWMIHDYMLTLTSEDKARIHDIFSMLEIDLMAEPYYEFARNTGRFQDVTRENDL
jgi:hypothetical protein